MKDFLAAGKVTSQVQGQPRRSKQQFRNIRDEEWEQEDLWLRLGACAWAEIEVLVLWTECVGWVQGEAAQGR